MKKSVYGTAQAAIDRSRVVCTARVSGRLDLAALGALIADVRGPASAGQLVHVVDYSAALIEIRPDELQAVADSIRLRDGANEIPAALIANRSQLELFRAYSGVASRAGVITRVFSSTEGAQQWAATQAEVIRYWADCRRRQPSP